MSRKGTVIVDGVTYYHQDLWKALVAQNLEMGLQQNADRTVFNRLYAERDAALLRASEAQEELDFALKKLDDAIQRVINFQHQQEAL